MRKLHKISISNKFFFSFFLTTLFFIPANTRAANLSILPVTTNVYVNDTVTVKINVDTLNKTINNAEGVIQFPADMLQVVSLSKSSSIFSLWVEEPSFSNSTGKITFNGGVPARGYLGANGSIFSITFKAKKEGLATVNFSSGTVRANDGLGTDITDNLTGASLNIKVSPVITTPKTEPVPISPTTPATQTPEPQTIPLLQSTPVVEAPEIASVLKDGVMTIIGKSGYSEDQVLVTFINQDGLKVFIQGTSDADGNFNLLVPNSINHGFYAVTAVMVQEDNTTSITSDAIVVKIGSIIYNISWKIWLLIGATLIILLLDLILHIHFYFNKKGRYKSSK